jgi:hypothetical protein
VNLRLRTLTLAHLQYDPGLLERIYGFMLPRFSPYYPEFRKWYASKVVSGFFNATRSIILIESDGETEDRIAGVSIVKRITFPNTHAKICSFYIDEYARQSGLGTRLLKYSLSELGHDVGATDIIMTVPEERLIGGFGGAPFDRFLIDSKFELIDHARHLYRYGKTELIWRRTFRSEELLDDRTDIKVVAAGHI